MINNDKIEEAKQVTETTPVVNQNTEVKKVDPPIMPDEVKKWFADNDYFVPVPAHQLKHLLEQLAEAKADRKILYEVGVSIMILFGYADPKTRQPIPEIVSGEESWMPGMLKSLSDIIGKLTKAKLAVTKNQKERYQTELAETFAFVKDFMPLITKYGNEQREQK